MKRSGLFAACVAAALAWGGLPVQTAAGTARSKGWDVASPPRAGAERQRSSGRDRTAAARAPVRRFERGRASYYSMRLAGQRMADGGRFNPRSDAAAHRSLPLGSTARVRNLRNGRSATVTVRDRGPHAPGRILDVSPGTAEQLGMSRKGVVPVEVMPVREPRPARSVSGTSAAAR